MRRAAFGLMVVLVCIGAFAQNATPQWKIIKTVQVVQGKQLQIPITTLFTPSKIGAYRYTAYLACFGPPQPYPFPSWALNSSWTESTGANPLLPIGCNFQNGNSYQFVGPWPFTPKPGVPVQFQLVASNPPPVDSTYSFWITIEHVE